MDGDTVGRRKNLNRNVVAILIAAAVITLACICCPAGTIPLLGQTPSPIPTVPSPSPVPPQPTAAPSATVVSTGTAPVCAWNLGELLQKSMVDTNPEGSPQLGAEFTLVTYTVSGDTLTHAVDSSVPNDLLPYQQDVASQQKIWDFFTAAVPAERRTMVQNFVLYTDGINGSLGAVEQGITPDTWMFEMDQLDAVNFADLSTTVVHEFAHLLSLTESQITPDIPVFNDPNNQQLFEQEAANCPNYFTFEGCSKPDSYINMFFNRFWPSIFLEWQAIDAEPDQTQHDQEIEDFYQKYSDQFVSDYAATSPSEDLAESFMNFVFLPKPSGAAVSDQKILFFYDYPELVTLRGHLLDTICSYKPGQ